jgi:hypothetical protein
MDSTHDEITRALFGMRQLEQVSIYVEADGFTWQLIGDGGREILTAPGAIDQVAAMLQCTEVLLNTELGVQGSRLARLDLN